MNIVDVLRKYFAPYAEFTLMICIFIIFVIAGYYAYNQYATTQHNRFKDVANENHRIKYAEVMFFHADWCPYCKAAQPEWDTFCSQNDGKEINGYVVKCVDVDCTIETDPEKKSIMDEFGVTSFPTVKLVKDNQTIDFDSKITSTSLSALINTVL